MKKLILTLTFLGLGVMSYAQFGSWGDWGGSSDDKPKKEKKKDEKKKDENASDSTSTEDEWGSGGDDSWGSNSGGSDWGGGSGWGESGGSGSSYQKPVAKKPVIKKEEKVLLPYDSVRKLIIYKGIQELEECEFCTEDSLYYRFKTWAKGEFGKKIFKNKKALGLDQKFQKINLKLKMPLKVKKNKYVKEQVGDVKLSLTIWFQPYRYKYLFSNFVHEVPPTGTQTEAQMVYFEYYQESKRNVQKNNQYLKAIDNTVKEYIEDMKVALNDKPVSLLDEDDW